ncbi:hypothetical protein [Streptomyces zingiberis]|uniref:Lipoprotein n=1 Tax=Streptomyces zingiberis TaxID=2053010 RepID=A0ABX1C0P5_9ACTN|nr:hypothetical protein [Streptomyces zingiberis]NJQ02240.1 hypothetical protein [Streptomyces zingiberis]
MPPTTPPRAPAGPRRRSLLAGVPALFAAAPAAALATACSDGDAAAEAARARADRRLRARSARDSRALLERYDATLAAHPGLAGLLTPLRAETDRHVRAFTERGEGGEGGASGDTGRDGEPRGTREPPGSPDGPRPEPSAGGPSGSPGTAGVPAERDAALAALARAERRAADARTRALVTADPELARLLASVAAAGAAHAYLLTEAA